MSPPILTSVTRASDLVQRGFELGECPRSAWRTGDFICGRVVETQGRLHTLELPGGRMMEAMVGDRVVGALGIRAATLEAVGSWQAMEGTGFEALTPAGLFGRLTSASPFLSPLMRLEYGGHLMRGGRSLGMADGLPPAPPETGTWPPVVLIVGTSMSAGKTLSGRTIVHLLADRGLRVAGAKLTGAARYRDVLSFRDAGAVEVFDFVDAGLPSTVCEEAVFRAALTYLMARIRACAPDVIVAEAGASPLEPYNGGTAMALLGDQVRFELLCAHDPYSVMGVVAAFQRRPDLVAGGAANTSAGRELVHKLTGLPALNLSDPDSQQQLATMLDRALGL